MLTCLLANNDITLYGTQLSRPLFSTQSTLPDINNILRAIKYLICLIIFYGIVSVSN
jgi:hypothetical protein